MINHRIEFSYGYFEIEGENEDMIVGRFKLKEELRWFSEKKRFVFYKNLTIAKRKYFRNEGAILYQYENCVLSLGPYYPDSLSRNFSLPFLASFIINHKTNPDSGFRDTPADTKKNDLKIIGNFYGNLIIIQKPINIQEYEYISFVPSKRKYNWCNTEELAKGLADILNVKMIKILNRIDDEKKLYESIPSLPISKNKKIIIVDDVYTSGETFTNIKKTLLKFAFSEILLITLGNTDSTVYELYYK